MFLYADLRLPHAPQLRLTHCPYCDCCSTPDAALMPSSGARFRVATDACLTGRAVDPRRRPPTAKVARLGGAARQHSRCSAGVCGPFGPGRFNECVSECESSKISLQYLPVQHLISSIPRKFFFSIKFLSPLIVPQQRYDFSSIYSTKAQRSVPILVAY